MENNDLRDDYSILEVKTIHKPPIKLDFVDYVNCPICDIEIDVKNKIINQNSSVYCEDCKHTIVFKIIKI